LIIAVVAFVVLGLGGVVFDHFFGGPVGSPAAVTAGTNPPALPSTVTSAPKSTQPGQGGSQLPASIPALLGLTKLDPSPAPAFVLESASGRSISLDSLRGKVVLLSFFDSTCNDICSVVATELRIALSDLGADASKVVILGVNTDPVATSLDAASEAQVAGGLGESAQWHFLTGSLARLDSVWKAYGVTIEVQKSTGVVSHNDLLYFIDAEGRLRLRATPFADESSTGAYSLPMATETRFASGIASSVRSLLETGDIATDAVRSNSASRRDAPGVDS
jgi:cytochrome oxidase Cu insertion factor (SCO1/SenC/PrrC family)